MNYESYIWDNFWKWKYIAQNNYLGILAEIWVVSQCSTHPHEWGKLEEKDGQTNNKVNNSNSDDITFCQVQIKVTWNDLKWSSMNVTVWLLIKVAKQQLTN